MWHGLCYNVATIADLQAEKSMKMNLVFRRFPTHESCIVHLEEVLWADEPHCPHCESKKVSRKREGKRVGRWNCRNCTSSFNVLSGTVFQRTRIPLQKWFGAIFLLLSTDGNVSSHQLAREFSLNQKSAWFMAKRIRSAKGKDFDLLIRVFRSVESSYRKIAPHQLPKTTRVKGFPAHT